jgi:hypothetical protein
MTFPFKSSRLLILDIIASHLYDQDIFYIDHRTLTLLLYFFTLSVDHGVDAWCVGRTHMEFARPVVSTLVGAEGFCYYQSKDELAITVLYLHITPQRFFHRSLQ